MYCCQYTYLLNVGLDVTVDVEEELWGFEGEHELYINSNWIIINYYYNLPTFYVKEESTDFSTTTYTNIYSQK